MKKYLQSTTITTGLAIFAMLFGSGNLIFPLKMGVVSGNLTGIGLIAFSITGILLPMIGLIGMVFFDGNYNDFFNRLGKIPGALLILLCMMIIGPLLIMPRIVGLTYKLMTPFMGTFVNMLSFSLFFCALTFICCYKKNSIVDLLGKILSPLKLLSLFTIIAIGWATRGPIKAVDTAWSEVFLTNFLNGYKTVDLLGTIFFAYIIISILKKTLDEETASNPRAMAKIMLGGGLIGGLLLAAVYIGMAYLGAFHGQNMNPNLSEGQVFVDILMKIMGHHGALFISLTVLVACLSTNIALASVVTEYLHHDVTKRKVGYLTLLVFVMGLTALISQFELDNILTYSAPIIFMIYPMVAVLTFCNIGYKVWNFKPVKIPVFITMVISIAIYGPTFYELVVHGPTKSDTVTIEQ